MKIVKLIGPILAVLAVAGVMAGNSAAAVFTQSAAWFIADPSTVEELKKATTLDTEVVEHPVLGKKFTLSTTIAGVPVDITATGLNCESCHAENKEVTVAGAKVAIAGGRLRFTGVTVDEPKECTVTSEDGKAGQIVTKVLESHWDFMDTGKAFVGFFPNTGTVYAQFKLGEGCKAIAGTYNLTGSLFGELKAGTGSLLEQQQVAFSPMILETTGGSLKVGANAATLTGTTGFGLTKEEGKKFVPFFGVG